MMSYYPMAFYCVLPGQYCACVTVEATKTSPNALKKWLFREFIKVQWIDKGS